MVMKQELLSSQLDLPTPTKKMKHEPSSSSASPLPPLTPVNTMNKSSTHNAVMVTPPSAMHSMGGGNTPLTVPSPITPFTTKFSSIDHKKGAELERRKNLTAKVKNQEHELKELGDKLLMTESQCKQQLETIAFLNRLWNNMNDELSIATKRLGSPPPLPSSSNNTNTTHNKNNTTSTISLYMHTMNIDAQNSNFSLCEQRCSQTRQFLQSIVDSITLSNQRYDELLKTSTGSSSTTTIDETIREDHFRLKKRCEQLESEMTRLQNEYRMASDRFESLQISNQRLTEELNKKNSALEESAYELKNTRHKLEKLYLDIQFSDVMNGGGGVGMNSSFGGSQTPVSALTSSHQRPFDSVNVNNNHGNSSMGSSVDSVDKDVQISELKRLLRARKVQSKEHIETISKLEQENQKLKSDMITEANVQHSSTYKNLFLMYQHQLCFVRQENNAKNDLLLKLEEMKKLNADEAAQMKSQYDSIIAKYQEKETTMTSEMNKLRQQYNEMDIRLKEETEKANRGESTLKKHDELQKRYDKKRKDFENLMKDHDKVKRLLEKTQKQLKERESSDTQKGDATMSDIEALKEELRVTKEQLQDKIEETQMYATELEEVSGSFSKIQDQTAKQKKQLDQKEQRITDLLKEQIEMKKINDALEIRINSSKQMSQASNNQIQILTEQVKAYQQKADEFERRYNENQQELVKLQLNFDKVRVTQKVRDTEVRDLSSECERVKKALESVTSRADDLQSKYNHASDDLKFKKEKIEGLEKRIKIMASNGPTKDMEGELSEYKRMVTCSVCQTRTKDVTIQRCHHTFCSECIHDNLKVRNRKCPACGIKFGSDDVKPVYL